MIRIRGRREGRAFTWLGVRRVLTRGLIDKESEKRKRQTTTLKGGRKK